MRWKIRFKVVVLAMASVVVWGQANAAGGQMSAEDRREAEQFAARMRSCREAMQTLKGHRLVVRVYPNIGVDPEKYVKASVPFDASGVQLSAIRAVCPLATQYAQIFFQTADQTDPAVARAFDDAVFLILYRDAPWQPQWVHGDGQTLEPYWTFLDAQGKPMSGASVQIGMIPSNRAIPRVLASMCVKPRWTRTADSNASCPAVASSSLSCSIQVTARPRWPATSESPGPPVSMCYRWYRRIRRRRHNPSRGLSSMAMDGRSPAPGSIVL